jgi:hypothetical protein
MSELGKVDATFKRKIGPLPVFGWVLIIGLAIVVARWYLQRGSSSAGTTTATDATDEADASSGDSGDLTDSEDPDDTDDVGGTDSSTGGVTNSTASTITYSTDLQWSQAVARQLDADGYQPGVVDTSIASYLAGIPLTQQGYSLMEIALQEFGPAPSGDGSLTLATPTTTTTTPTPAPTTTTKTPTSTPVTTTKTPAAVSKPATPDGFALGSSGTTLVMTWDAVANATFYQILRVDGSLYWQGAATSLSNPNQQAGHTYTFSCRAGNAAGLSAPTAPHVHTIPKNA